MSLTGGNRVASKTGSPLAGLLRRRELPHHVVEIEARGPLSNREFLEALEPLGDQSHGPVIDVNVVHQQSLYSSEESPRSNGSARRLKIFGMRSFSYALIQMSRPS